MMIGLLKNKNELLLKAQKEKRPEDDSKLDSGSNKGSNGIPSKCQEGDVIVFY